MSETPTIIVKHVYPTIRQNVRGQLAALTATAVVIGGGLAVVVGIGEIVTRVNNRVKTPSSKKR